MPDEHGRRSITICIDERRWRRLLFEARLLPEVFGQVFTPADGAQVRLGRSLSRVTGQPGRTTS